jgi:hypothetical protein
MPVERPSGSLVHTIAASNLRQPLNRLFLLITLGLAPTCGNKWPEATEQTSHLGRFEGSYELAFLRFENRLTVTENEAEYWSRATENGLAGTTKGRERASQSCKAAVLRLRGKPAIGNMICTTFIDGRRKERSANLKFDFDGTSWIHFVNGKPKTLNKTWP